MTSPDGPSSRQFLPPRGALGRLRAIVRSSEFALALIALVVGAAAGVMVMLMSRTVQWLHVLLFGIDLNERLSAAVQIPFPQTFWPVVGGVILGVMAWLAVKLKRPASVDPIEANALRGGQMPMFDSMVVAAQTLISSGFGASVGLEAGYTQAGSGFASWAGQRLKLRRADLRVLVGAGAAGAIAAAFSAPICGAFYAFEIVIGAYTVANVAPVMAAAICGMLVSQSLGGALYHIEVRAGAAVTNLDYLLFIGLGVACAGLAIAMMRSMSAPRFERARRATLTKPSSRICSVSRSGRPLLSSAKRCSPRSYCLTGVWRMSAWRSLSAIPSNSSRRVRMACSEAAWTKRSKCERTPGTSSIKRWITCSGTR